MEGKKCLGDFFLMNFCNGYMKNCCRNQQRLASKREGGKDKRTAFIKAAVFIFEYLLKYSY